jgi:hypothetical protein
MSEEKTVKAAGAEEKKEVAVQPHNKVADFSDGGIYNSSDSFTLAMNMAKTLAGSTIVPPAFQKSWENCMVALSQSKKLGVDPFVVMNNMYMIQGKITWKSEFVIAMINASGKFDTELQFEEEEKDGKPFACTAYTFKDGRKIAGIRVTMDMANAEGWTKKNGTKWATLPQLMLRYRAAVFFARFNAPELTSGLYTVEEGEDVTFNTPHKIKKSTNLNDIIEDENIIDVDSSGEVV